MKIPVEGPLVIVVARSDVDKQDISAVVAVFKRLLESVETARLLRERVDISFHGYDADRRELFEIPEVRQFVASLDRSFPYWLYFLTRHSTGLQAIAFCFLPPYLTAEAQRSIWPQRLGELIERRWGPALAQIGAQVGLEDEEVTRMLADSAHYFLEGPRLPFDAGTA